MWKRDTEDQKTTKPRQTTVVSKLLDYFSLDITQWQLSSSFQKWFLSSCRL